MNTASTAKLPGDWGELNRLFPLRPIRDEERHERALKILDRLAVAEKRSRDQEDYLESLSNLMETYEREHHRTDTAPLDPAGTLRFLMEQHGWNGSDLGRFLGTRTLGPELVRGKKELSKTHIAKLAKHFGVNPGVFIDLRKGD